MTGIGPVPATAKVLASTGLSLADLELVEINEAFACQVLSVLAEWGWDDPDKLNVNGSGISLGHPIAATGVRIMTTMLQSCVAEAADMRWRPCASAGARGWPPYSKQHERPTGRLSSMSIQAGSATIGRARSGGAGPSASRACSRVGRNTVRDVDVRPVREVFCETKHSCLSAITAIYDPGNVLPPRPDVVASGATPGR